MRWTSTFHGVHGYLFVIGGEGKFSILFVFVNAPLHFWNNLVICQRSRCAFFPSETTSFLNLVSFKNKNLKT